MSGLIFFDEKNLIISELIVDVRRQNFVSLCDSNQIDHDKFNPYDNWCTILYTYIKDSKKYKVIGYMMYDDPHTVHPLICINNEACLFINDEKCEKPIFKLPWLSLELNGFEIQTNDNNSLNEDICNIINCTQPKVFDVNKFMMIQMAKGHVHDFQQTWEKNQKQIFLNMFDGVTEEWTNRLLNYNNVPIGDREVKPTEEDKILFYNNNPCVPPPEKWYAIPLVDMPFAEFYNYKVYENATIHIAYDDIKYFFWNEMIKVGNMICTHLWKGDKDNELNEHIERVADIITDKSKRKRDMDGVCDNEIDMEDLYTMLPPCMTALLNKGSFPVDNERTVLMGVLKYNRVPLDVIDRLMDKMNDSGQDTLKRWNHHAYYNTKYNPTSCVKVHERKLCTFKGDKSKCLALFNKSFPEAASPYNEGVFFTPASWIHWIFKAKNKRRHIKL